MNVERSDSVPLGGIQGMLSRAFGDSWQRRQLVVSVTTAVVFWLAYGFGMSNLMYGHDSLAVNSLVSRFTLNGPSHELALGRYLQPVLHFLRGGVNAPWLIGALCIAWLSATSLLLATVLSVRSTVLTSLTSALCVLAPAFTHAFATYLPFADVFAASYFFGVLSVFLVLRAKTWRGCAASALCVCACCALYQPSFAIVPTVIVLALLQGALHGDADARDIIATGVRGVLGILVGLGLYAVTLLVIARALGVVYSTGYNSVLRAGDFSGLSIRELAMNSWLYSLTWWSKSSCAFSHLVGFAAPLAILGASTYIVLDVARRQRNVAATLLVMALVLLLPFAANCVYFIDGGYVHGLMTFAIWLLLMVPIIVSDELGVGPSHPTLRSFARCLMALILVAICYCQFVFSNDLLVEKELVYGNTSSVLTRVLERIYDEEGYVPGSTPVVFLYDSENRAKPLGFDHLRGVGSESPLSVTYAETFEEYFAYIIPTDINVVTDRKEIARYGSLPEVESMGVFPERDSVAMVDGAVVVRL